MTSDGYYNVRFKLYSGVSGGSALWTETYLVSGGNGVRTANGYLTTSLGTLTAFPSSINWGQQLYLTMEIGGTGTSPVWDGEMSPRLPLTSVPSAFALNSYNGSNGYSSSLSILQPTGGNQIFQIQDQTAAGTYSLCIAGSTACGFAAATGGAGYIQNQTASAQAASNFWISGTGKAATALQAPSFDSVAATNLSIGTTNATSITLGKSGVNTIVAGNLSVGTTSSYGAITIANGAWVTGLDSAGTGYINMLSVNGNNEIQVGAALNIDGGIVLPTDGGQMTFSDLPISASAVNGTAQSYTLRVGSSNALTVYGEADGAGNAKNIRVAIGGSISPLYTLDVVGEGRFSGRVIGADAVGVSEFTTLGQVNTMVGSAGSYIQNSTTLQTSANFNISGSGAIGTTLTVSGTGNSSFAGKVGIGTTSPQAPLHIVSGSNTIRFNDGASSVTPNISIGTSAGKSMALMVGTGGAAFTFDSSGVFVIAGDTKSNIDGGTSNGGTVLLTVTGSGNLGLGNVANLISSSYKLNVQGGAMVNGDIAFQNAAATELLLKADTTNNRIVIGNATGTGANTTTLVLDTAASDPTGAPGAMYYQTGTNKFRCYVNSGWADCGGTGAVIASGSGSDNKIAKFSGGQLADSALSDNGSTLTYTGGNLLLGTGGVSPQATTIKAAAATGSNVKGGDLTIDASNGTGSGGSGDIILRTAAPAAGSGAPVIGTYTRVGNGNANLLSFSHTVDAGSNRLLLVEVVVQSNGASVTSMSYGGQALTPVTNGAIGHNFNSDRVEMWYLVNPPTGSATLITNLNSYRAVQVIAMNVTGVNQTTPLGTAAVNQGSGNTASVSVSATNLDTVVDVVASDSSAPTVGAGQTSIWGAQQGVYGAGSYKSGTGTVTSSWTGSLNNWVIAAVPVLSASSSSATNILTEGIRVTSLGRVGINSSVPSAMLQVATNAAGAIGQILQGSTGQAADLLRFMDSAGNVNAAINATGNQLTLGRIATVGTVTQGKLVLADGTANGFGLTLQAATLTANRILTLPDASGTLCTTATCGGGTGNVSYGTPAGDGTGTAYTKATITRSRLATIDADGSLNASELGFATGYLQYTGAAYALDMAYAGTSTLTVKNSDGSNKANLAVTGTVNGLTLSASALSSATGVALAITGGTTLSLQSSSTNAVTLDSGTTGNVNIGTNANGKTITIGNITDAVSQTLNLGYNGTNGSTSNVNIGSTVDSSTTNIKAGAGGLGITSLTTTTTSSATVQNAAIINANNLTTGTGLKVSTTSNAIASGSLLEVSQSSAYASAFTSSNKLLNVNRTVTGPPVATNIVISSVSTGSYSWWNIGNGAHSLAINHTVGTGSNRALIVAVNATNISTVTFNNGSNYSLTQMGVSGQASLWILVNPPSGIGTVTISSTSTYEIAAVVSSWDNVNQATPYGTAAGGAWSTSSISQVVSTSPGQMVIDSVAGYYADYGPSYTPDAGQTLIGGSAPSGPPARPTEVESSYKAAAAGSTTMSWQNAQYSGWIVAVPLNQAGASSGRTDGTLTGSVANIASTCAGCTETGSILNLQQANTLATGAVLSIQNSGLGPDILLGSGIIRSASNSTTALRVQNADGSSNILTIDSTNGRVGIGNVADLSSGVLTVQATNDQASVLTLKNTSGISTLEVRAGNATSVLIGVGAGQNTTGGSNTAIGYGALQSNVTATNNTAIGYGAMQLNTAGLNNVALGYYAFQGATGGSYNTALGAYAMQNTTTGSYNIGGGMYSLGANTTGSNNIALGQYSMYSNQTGEENIALGHYALRYGTAGGYNIALGNSSLASAGGFHNIGLGYAAGYSNTTGSRNVFLGYYAGYLETGSDKLYVANNSSTALIQGDFATSDLTFNSTLTLLGAANSATGFVIQRPSNGDILFTANTSTNRLIVGNGAGANANVTLFVLDKAASDPSSAQAGAMYYSTGTGTFRCYTTAWGECAGSGGGGSGWSLTGNNAAGSVLGSNVTTSANFVISSRPNNVGATSTGASYISFSGDQYSNPNRIVISGNANSNSAQGGGSWTSSNTKDYFRIQDSNGNAAFAVQGSSAQQQVFMYLAAGSSVGVSGRVCSTLAAGGSGMATMATCTNTGTDLAEAYRSTESLEAGDIVAVDHAHYPNVVRSTQVSQRDLVGIVSTEPNETMGTQTITDGYPIALNGRVPTKVNGEGGAIHPGDKITSSTVAGVGKKATTAGMIVGTALTGFDGNGQGTIEVFVHLIYYEPSASEIIQGQGGESASLNGSLDVAYDLNVSGQTTLDTLEVVGSAAIGGDLVVSGTTAVANLIVGKHILSRAVVPTVGVGSAAGLEGQVTIDGTDVAGTLNITVKARLQNGSTPAETLSAGSLADVTFLEPYEFTPRIVISPTNQASVNAPVYLVKTATGWQLMTSQAAADGTQYQFDYVIIASQGQTAAAGN
jgi:hypothetical protein